MVFSLSVKKYGGRAQCGRLKRQGGLPCIRAVRQMGPVDCLGVNEMNVRPFNMRPSEGVKHSDGWIDIFENRLHLYPYQRIICTI